MRVMMIVKGTPEQEAAGMPADAEKMFADMAVYNNELIAAGLMLDGVGLLPTKLGKKVRFAARGDSMVIDGPFTETKELIGGYWLLKVKDMDEAIAWARRIPFDSGEVELRIVAEPESFGDLVTEEVKTQEQEWRAEQERRAPKATA